MKLFFIISVFALIHLSSNTAFAINLTGKVQKLIDGFTQNLSDPLILEGKNIQLNNENIQLNLILDGTISGIKSLAVNKFELSPVGLKITNFEFNLPKLNMNINSYDLDGKLGLIHLFGKGTLLLNIENLIIKGNAKLIVITIDGIRYAHITAVNGDFSINNDAFDFAITGWLNDEVESKYITNIINNMIHNMTPEIKDKLNKKISDFITTFLKNYKIPLGELIKP